MDQVVLLRRSPQPSDAHIIILLLDEYLLFEPKTPKSEYAREQEQDSKKHEKNTLFRQQSRSI